MDDQQVHLDVVGVRIERPSNQPVILLRGADPGTEHLHVAIMVGTVEANAVAKGLRDEQAPRPLTHDLLVDVLRGLGGGVESVEIGLLNASTYFGLVTVVEGRVIDARASDALAIAVRVQCPVTMDLQTLRAVAVTPRAIQEGEDPASAEHPEDSGPISEDEIQEFRRFLDGADPEDFREEGG